MRVEPFRASDEVSPVLHRKLEAVPVREDVEPRCSHTQLPRESTSKIREPRGRCGRPYSMQMLRLRLHPKGRERTRGRDANQPVIRYQPERIPAERPRLDADL